ncbi:YbdK family carboxylate-amine ligase [Actinoplanes sp. NEAU-A12]|uniref:Putative glutamate--cysteine ligase 2 n=1 Tax=Actinoplanes sandaracinus TaxID=3045177 RepID=A0ABT6WZY2_9ACTN|nr:YbdK family carboxylate-amine ligase [Actinoplanes sandaracinus]MDI6105229.1 YbdK family carboxylate-amine ligase [Actinoplanes sandaracinus]
MGVEEEFLLLDPDGAVAPEASAVVRHTGGDDRIKPEYMAYQVETATSVCTGLDELRQELTGLRLIAARAADRAGVHLVASGSPPFRAGPIDALTDGDRYRRLAHLFPEATRAGATCGCHVHIGVPDRELAAAVLTRIRPWLPALLALTVNSPVADAGDTGWSSHRYRTQLCWPTFRPPGVWASAARYDAEVRSHVASGAALDASGIYFLARLSSRYPTIEVRVADTGLSVDDTLLFAGVTRALIGTLIEDVRQRMKVVPAPDARVSADLLSVARGGGRMGKDVARLLAKITPQLDGSGDTGEVYAGVERLRREGTGAERQRRLWRQHGPTGGFVAALAAETTPALALHA